jgi:hypothetical protein
MDKRNTGAYMGKTPDYSKHTLYKKTKKLDELIGDECLIKANCYFGTDNECNKNWYPTVKGKLVWDSDLGVYLVQED